MGRHAEDWEERVEIRIQRSHGDEGGGREGEARDDGESGASVWEWVVAAIGAVVVLGALGIVLYEGISQPETPPQIEVTVDTVFESGAGTFAVEMTVRNRGRTTAAGLMVEGELRSDTGVVETAQATLDYVPGESRRRAGLIFSHDPSRFALEVRALGYDIP